MLNLLQELFGGLAQVDKAAPVSGERKGRREDYRLVTGTGCFSVDKLPINCLHVPFVHSTSPSSRITELDISEAGMIGAPTVILNASIDPLRPLRVTTLDLPLSSE